MSSRTLQSLSNAQLDAQLRELGAATFGSMERKRQRLQRFLRARDARIAQAYWEECALAEAAYQAQQAQREDTEEEPPLKRRRIEACPRPDSAPAPAPVRRPALPSTHRMVTRSARRNSRVAAQNAMDRIRSVIAEFLA